MTASKPCRTVCSSVLSMTRASLSVGMTTVKVTWAGEANGAAGGPSLRGLLRFVEHEIHDDQNRRPKDDLLVPEQDFAIMKESQRQPNRNRHDSVSEGRHLDRGVGPDSETAEINQKGDHVDLEAATDREKHIEKADEHQRRSDHQADNAHLMIAARILAL